MSVTIQGGNSDIIYGGVNDTITVAGNTNIINEASTSQVYLTGSSNTVGLDGTGDYVGILGGSGNVAWGDNSGDWISLNADTSATVYGSGGAVGLLGSNASLVTSNETVGTVANDFGETVTGNANTINEAANSQVYLTGSANTIGLDGASDYVGFLAGTGNVAWGDNSSDWISLNANTSTTVYGSSGGVGLLGSNASLTTSNETVDTVANVLGETVVGDADTVNEAANAAVNISGNDDAVNMTGANDYVGMLTGGGNTVNGDNAGDSVALLSNIGVTVTGIGGQISLFGSNDAITTSNETISAAANVTSETVSGTGDMIWEAANSSFNVAGGYDAVDMTGASDYVGVLSGAGNIVYGNSAGDAVNLLGNVGVTVTGSGGQIGVFGSNDAIATNNQTVVGIANDQNETVSGTGDAIWEAANSSFNVSGGSDSVHMTASGDYLGLLGGSGYSVAGTGDTIDTLGNTSFNLVGGNDTVGLGGSGDYLGLLGGSGYAVTGTGDTINTLGNTSFDLSGGNDTVGLGGTGDSLGLLSGTGYVVNNNITGDQVNMTGAVTATVNGSGGSIGVSGIDAIYNQVLCRDMSAAELASAQAELATGTSLNSLEAQLASSAEAQADMASTYAAVGDAGQLDAQPQCTSQLLNTDDVDAQVTTAPTQTEFSAFADAMSTSYGAPIELFSVDPASGAKTELADTSATNLLAELPVLETLANGANLGLQLADGTQIQFASTARTATFLYSLAVQQMQATSFVTDNYNLDMQWLNTVDQPLLEEADYWSERATAEASAYPERTVEDNAQAHIALRIAAEAPSSRQNMTETIANAATGNPTQITVYANGSGSSIHDVAPSVLSIAESLVSTVVDIAAVVTGQAYLYFAAAAIDAAEAGQAFSNGQDLSGLLSVAQALSAGIIGAAGGTTPLGATPTAPPSSALKAAEVISAAAEGVGGVYGVVQSAQNGNAAGILAGALEAAAAAATGIGIYQGGATNTLNTVVDSLNLAGAATNMASDFASGNLAQGLVDSLNLYLPAVGLAKDVAQTNQAKLQMIPGAIAAAGASPAPIVNIPDFGNTVTAAVNAGASGVNATVTPVAAGGVANVDNTVGSDGTGAIVTQSGQIYLLAATPTSSGDTIQATPSGTAAYVMSFLGLSSSAALPTVGQFNQTVADKGTAGALGLFENLLNIGPNAIDYNNLYLVEGYEPPGAYHAYLVSGTTGYATAQQAFTALLQAPAGAASPTGNGPVQSGQVSSLGYLGDVTTYVDAKDLTIFNVTDPNHLLYPGIVERFVVQGTDGLFHINTYGEGNGILPYANRDGRLDRDSVSVPLSGSSAGWVHPVPLPGSHAGRA